MSYCFNPGCPRPQNPDARFCQACGSRLALDDRYIALKVLGQGGFGRTFLGRDRASDPPLTCVIKQYFPVGVNVQYRDRASHLFFQEAERLAQLGRHPQIPTLLDYFELKETQYLVQEWIDGPNLETLLIEHGPFDEAEIRQVLGDLLPVLRFIHQRQIIHRDIKPENIIGPRSGDRLVLVDFGSSKYVANPSTSPQTVIGSAGYSAPEQMMGKAQFASDLYSLGVTCLHLLTGRHPFDLFSVGDNTWVWQNALIHPISPALQRVLTKLVQPATRQRYESATQVLQDLGLESVPVLSRTARSQGTVAIATPERVQIQPAPRTLAPPVPSPVPWRCVHTLTGHSGSITAIAIHPNSQSVISGSSDKTVKQWDMISGELQHTIAAKSLWFSEGHGDRITALAMTPDGRTLISAAADGDIKLWDANALKWLADLNGHTWSVLTLAMDATGDRLISGGGDGSLALWDLETFEEIQQIQPHSDGINQVQVTANSCILVSAGRDRLIRLWALPSLTLQQTLKAHVDEVTAIALTPDGATLISGSRDKTIKLWDIQQGVQTQVIAAHSDAITCLAIHPDGALLASGGLDGTIQLWPLEQGDRTHRIPRATPTMLRQSWDVTALAFSADGQWLVSGSTDETIKVWRCPHPAPSTK